MLLVAQPHLLGLPGIRRDNQKERKKLRKQERERTCKSGSLHHSDGEVAMSEVHRRSEKLEVGRATSGQAGGSADVNDVDVGGRDGGQQLDSGRAAIGQRKANPQQKVSMDATSPTPQTATALEPQHKSRTSVGTSSEALWRICTRHTVNVGGLISYVLVLNRTHASVPLPRSYRRKRLVGVDAYCKNRREDEE